MEAEDLRKAEYDNLYKEIQENSTKVYQVLTICSVGTTGLLSYAFTVDPSELPYHEFALPFLLLLPYLIILPSVMLVQSSLHSTVRLAGYLVVNYEGQGLPTKWQSSIQAYRKLDDSAKTRPFKWALISVFVGLSVACLFASILAFSYVCQERSEHNEKWGLFIALYCCVAPLLSLLVAIILKGVFKEWRANSFEAEISRWRRVKALLDGIYP